jgi:hypothetical protein
VLCPGGGYAATNGVSVARLLFKQQPPHTLLVYCDVHSRQSPHALSRSGTMTAREVRRPARAIALTALLAVLLGGAAFFLGPISSGTNTSEILPPVHALGSYGCFKESATGEERAATASPMPVAPRRYLLLMQATEGMAGWMHSLREASAIAAASGRVLVEPCVRDGHFLPCRVGAVPRVPDGTLAPDLSVAEAGVDAIGVPASRIRCNLPDVPETSLSLPLSAYFDWESLQRDWSLAPMVRYHEWAEEALGTADTPGRIKFDETMGKFVVSAPLIAGKPDANGCKNGTQTGSPYVGSTGDFFFATISCSRLKGWERHEDIARMLLHDTRLADTPDVFATEWTRTPSSDLETTLSPRWPQFNKLHYVAVRRWVANELRLQARDKRYAVFQWRSVLSGTKNMGECLNVFLNATSSLPALLSPSNNSASPSALLKPLRAVLVSDLPSPGSPCRIWDHAAGDTVRDSAVSSFNALGLAKYDAFGPASRLDGGMLAIRDMILGIEAEWYFTCSRGLSWRGPLSSQCVKCSWSSSYVFQTILQRAARNATSNTDWATVRAQNVTPPLPRVLG